MIFQISRSLLGPPRTFHCATGLQSQESVSERPASRPAQPKDIDQLFESLNTHCGCTRGAGGAASNYLAFGTSMDYMYHDLKVSPGPYNFKNPAL